MKSGRLEFFLWSGTECHAGWLDKTLLFALACLAENAPKHVRMESKDESCFVRARADRTSRPNDQEVIFDFIYPKTKKKQRTILKEESEQIPTLFAVYNLKDKQMKEEYDKYLTEAKIPGIRGAPWCTAFNTWKIDRVLAAAVSEPEGEMPSEPPYMYVAKIEVSDLDAMVAFLGTEAGKNFMKSWSIYLDPTSIFTMAHDM